MDDNNKLIDDFAHVVRLALAEKSDDVRLLVARLVRRYRNINPALAKQMESYLRSKTPRAQDTLRKTAPPQMAPHALPVDDESQLSLLKMFQDQQIQEQPLLSTEIHETLHQLIQERRQAERLKAVGLTPTRSAIFVGPPGVGKTLTARWLTAQLGVPLYVLDLAAIMSSLLGRSGSNVRAVFDFAKRNPCVLLLDEIDAIAKRRSDDTDVGELKRLVTVILQEVDEWPPSGLLLAATNHPDLIDPALWRRFDLVVEFKMPDTPAIETAIKRFLGPDLPSFSRWTDILAFAFIGDSFSNIERVLQRFRRSLALNIANDTELVEEFVKSRALDLDRQRRTELAVLLANETRLSHHTISGITRVSRDTIRKYTKTRQSVTGAGTKRRRTNA